MKKQVHVYYTGQVQGVGFRFTAEDIAKRLGISGWVKNLHDGRVEIVAEAEEAVLKDFLEHIKQKFYSYINDIDLQWQDATGPHSGAGRFKGFEIRF